MVSSQKGSVDSIVKSTKALVMPHLELEPRQRFAANRKPAPDVGEGWTTEEVTRASRGTKTAGNRDRYWYSPLTGKKFRSTAEVRRFQNILAGLAGSIVEGDEDRAWRIFKQASTTAKKKPAVKSQFRKETSKLETPRQAAPKDAAPRKRAADQLGEDIDQEDACTSISGTMNSSAKSAADVTSRPRKKKAQPAPPAVDWRVQRIVRDLGRLDVLRRGDVGPDVVSDDEDETALDILVRKLV